MRSGLIGVTAASFLCSSAMAQTVASSMAQQIAPAPQSAPLKVPVVLKQDTPLELMATSEISTASATAGTQFKLRVNKAVTVGGDTVVPVGAWAYGDVIAATASGGLGKSGTMTARIKYLKLGDVQIPLEGEVRAKGTGAGSAGMAILFTGWAGLFHRGNNAKIKAGEIVTAFVGEDVALDLSDGQIRKAAALPQPTAAPDQAPATAPTPSPAVGGD